MDASTAGLIALIVVALLLIAFFAVFRNSGKFLWDTKRGIVKAEGKNLPSPKAVPSGVKVTDAMAGRDFRAESTSEGGVELEKIKAQGRIDAQHTQGESPPKG